jgi:hypothetical protein
VVATVVVPITLLSLAAHEAQGVIFVNVAIVSHHFTCLDQKNTNDKK